MKKRDLIPGSIVRTKNGSIGIVVSVAGDSVITAQDGEYIVLSNCDENLNCKVTAESPIKAVYQGNVFEVAAAIANTVAPVWSADIKEITRTEAYRALEEFYGQKVKIVEE